MKTTGVYCITNYLTGRRYVGASRDVERRWTGHRGALLRGDHPCSDLQKDWNWYGQDSFHFQVLEKCDIPQLVSREEKWIRNFHGTSHGVYNSRLVPTSISTRHGDKKVTKIKLTPEARDLIDAIAKRRGVSQASVIEWVMREKAESLGIRHGDPTEAEPPLDASTGEADGRLGG